MRFLVLLSLFFFWSCILNAQTILTKDQNNQSALLGVHLRLNSLEGLLLFEGYTNDDGALKLPISSPDSFLLSANYFGFTPILDSIFSRSDSLIVYMLPYYYSLDEVVVTAQIDRTSRSQSVNNIVTISRKEIEQTASINLADILSQQALFDLSIDPAIGTSISIQGLQGNNMNILVDGVPVIGRKGSQIDVSQLNLSNVEKIEILKGPASVSYGSNSTGGVINLITKTNFEKDKLEFSVYVEDVGVQQIIFDAQTKIHRNNINVNIGKYDFSGYSTDKLRSKEWKPKSQNFAHFMWNSNIKNSQIRLKSYVFDEIIIDFGAENFPPFDGSATDQYYLTHRNINDIKFSNKNTRYSIKSLASFATTKFIKEQYQVDLVLDSLTQTDNTDFNAKDIFKAIYSRMEYNRLDLGKISFQLGLELRQENVSGSKIKMGEAEIFECALFSKSEIEISPIFKTQLGFRIPYHSIYDAPVTPSIHIQLSPKSWFQWRGSYARGFRAPSIKELFMEFVDFNHNIVGNEDLNAEYSHAYNSSISFTPIKQDEQYFRVDIESSLQYLKDKINLAQIENSTGYTYYNLSQAVYYGFSATVQAKLNGSSSFQMGWNNYITEASELYDPIKRQNFTFVYNLKSIKYHLGGNINIKIKTKNTFQRIEEDILVNFQQDAYQLVNMNLFKDFHQINARLSLGVKNLLDVTNIQAAGEQNTHSGSESIISWGRTYFAQFKINFQ